MKEARAEADAVTKRRGAFFTPPEIADFLTEWAVRTPNDRVLEPSCGEAVFLISAVRRLQALGAAPTERQLHGIDIHEDSVRQAEEELAQVGASGSLEAADFFDLRPDHLYDVVLGNPPYIRYQSFTGKARAKALEAALAQGVRLTGLASSWAAFVVHAASFLKPEGRLALVLPAELLTVSYAAPVRRFLLNRFANVQLVLFEERIFPGVLEEVVLLLAEGAGPTEECELCQTVNLEALCDPVRTKWSPTRAEEKWTPALLSPEATQAYTDKISHGSFSTLLDWGETTLGMVSGNNRYFALSGAQVEENGLEPSDLLRISPPGSRHLRDFALTDASWQKLLESGSRCFLFDPRVDAPSETARKYIAAGEEQGIHKAYKCRVRTPWWKVPRVGVPDLFLTYMNHDAPRLVANRARVAYLNSVHGVMLKSELRQFGRDLLPLAMLNSVTLLGAELVGRAYGGGLLKLEPKEADRLPVPSVDVLRDAERPLRSLLSQLSRTGSSGSLEEIVRWVDRVLLQRHLSMEREELDSLRSARRQLFERRESRAKSTQ